MKKCVRWSAFLLLMVAMLSLSCCRQDRNDLISPFEKKEGNLTVTAAITELNTRTNNNEWSKGDKVGVYPYTGDVLSKDNLIDNGGRKGNRKYVTEEGDGHFTSLVEGVWLEGVSANLIAYYPYNADLGSSLEYQFDVSNQSDHALIDLLYSDNVKGVTAVKNSAAMIFDHALTLVVLNVTSESLDLSGKEVVLSGALVDGAMSLVDGKVTTGATKKDLSQKLTSVEKSFQASFILPPQDLKSVKVNVMGVGKEAKAIDLETTQGHKHVIDILIKANGELVIGSAKINDWLDGKSPDGPIILDPIEDNPVDPTPDPTPSEGQLLFPGADFEDFDAFKAVLNRFGIKYAVQSPAGEGRNGSKALKLSFDSATGNDYIFTTTVQGGDSFVGKSKIVFYVKGTAAKSLSINVYESDGTSYKPYNLGDMSNEDMTLAPSERNGYIGTINTGGEWRKVTLDISSLTLNSTVGGNFFALKIGKSVPYDLVIDDFMIE